MLWQRIKECILADKKMYYCYIIYSSKANFFYIDSTIDIDSVMTRHNSAVCVSTKPFLPWDLVWYSEFETEKEARDCESYLKSRNGREFAYRKLIPTFYMRKLQNNKDSVVES
jgi:putative endonuclease